MFQIEFQGPVRQILTIVAACIMLGLFLTPLVFYPLKVWLIERRRVRSVLRSQIRELRDLAERVGSPYHMARLGAALVEAGEVDEAIDWLRRALDADPGDADARFHLARAYLERNEAGRARELLEPLVDRDPSYAYGEAALLYARAVEECGSPDQALAAYERLLRYYPNNPEGSYRYAMLLHRLGRSEEAKQVLQEMVRAIENGPSFQRQRQRAWLRRAKQWLTLHP